MNFNFMMRLESELATVKHGLGGILCHFQMQ